MLLQGIPVTSHCLHISPVTFPVLSRGLSWQLWRTEIYKEKTLSGPSPHCFPRASFTAHLLSQMWQPSSLLVSPTTWVPSGLGDGWGDTPKEVWGDCFAGRLTSFLEGPGSCGEFTEHSHVIWPAVCCDLGVGGRPDNTDPVTDEDGHTTFLDSILDNVTSGISTCLSVQRLLFCPIILWSIDNTFSHMCRTLNFPQLLFTKALWRMQC